MPPPVGSLRPESPNAPVGTHAATGTSTGYSVGDAAAINEAAEGTSVIGTWNQDQLLGLIEALITDHRYLPPKTLRSSLHDRFARLFQRPHRTAET